MALVAVQQRSVVMLGEGNLNLQLRAGRVGVSAIGRRLGPDEVFQIDTPNVRTAFRGGNVVVKTAKVGQADQTTVYVVGGSAEISQRNVATRRPVKLESPRQLTVTGKTFGEARALSAVDSARLLAELRSPSHQHVDTPDQIDSVIVRHGRTEAVKQTKLVAEQLKQAKAQRQHDENGQRSRSEAVTSFATGQRIELAADPKANLGGSGTGGSGHGGGAGTGGGTGNGLGSFPDKGTPIGPVNPNWSDPGARAAERARFTNPAIGASDNPAGQVHTVQPGTTPIPSGQSVTQQSLIRRNTPVTVVPQQVAPSSR